ncbi:3-oxoadipate enol-lactonase [Denitratisoma sp. DHT3]|uniref:3-oxoadipate enol-lactonase n=1 Tax=Denitratisoma sp. DHT3 TaxID=1981880 RepID=UPI00119878B0|nr:3-oxoadipate enol-lactonase [Denitratisoma sp. DHT3]QDX82309.1 3-oxoadipate enol-lactonase [Denitratisoma sp. DHT3]
MAILRSNGIDIRYRVEGEVRGDRPWLTLCHSLACDLSMWDDQIAALTSCFNVLRYDIRGHGGSSAPDLPYGFEMMVADLLGLLDGLGVAQTHFCGLSLGGMIGQYFALMAPRRLDRLVLCSTSSGYGAGNGVEKLWEQRIAQARAGGMAAMVEGTLERWFTEPYRCANPAVMERIGTLIRNTPLAGYAGCGRMVASLDTTGRLVDIQAPTLVLVGEDDAGTPPAMAEVIARGIPQARLELLPQASHLCNVEQAELFNELLLAFLG